MSKLFKMEHKFFIRSSSNNLKSSALLKLSGQQESGVLIRTDTADFPMKLVTHGLIQDDGMRGTLENPSMRGSSVVDLH